MTSEPNKHESLRIFKEAEHLMLTLFHQRKSCSWKLGVHQTLRFFFPIIFKLFFMLYYLAPLIATATFFISGETENLPVHFENKMAPEEFFGCWYISNTILGKLKKNTKFQNSVAYISLTKYPSKAVFKTNKMISPITWNKERCCSI